jgi:hypothetical protein
VKATLRAKLMTLNQFLITPSSFQPAPSHDSKVAIRCDQFLIISQSGPSHLVGVIPGSNLIDLYPEDLLHEARKPPNFPISENPRRPESRGRRGRCAALLNLPCEIPVA